MARIPFSSRQRQLLGVPLEVQVDLKPYHHFCTAQAERSRLRRARERDKAREREREIARERERDRQRKGDWS